MLKADYSKYVLRFKNPSGTSRGVLTRKETFFIELRSGEFPDRKARGECGLLRGLSADDRPGYEKKLAEICDRIDEPRQTLLNELKPWPSIRAGLEAAFSDLDNGCRRLYFPGAFTRGERAIPINGLIWMGNKAEMLRRIEEKINAGFTCVKMKIGAIDFNQEIDCIRHIRSQYSLDKIELRVDANGAFTPSEARKKLETLAQYDIHSIEQPLKAGMIEETAELCRENIIPVALDEELIGIWEIEEKERLLERIQPQYIILKPSLVGGFAASEEWIAAADKCNIGWWATSALESNIGLNAIAQWCAVRADHDIPQGLGTGELYVNNIPGPTFIRNGALHYDTSFSPQSELP